MLFSASAFCGDYVAKDAVGLDIIIDMGTDISAATTTDIKVKKPDGTTATWTGAVYNTNYIKYTTVADDLDQAGVYQLQPDLVISGYEGRGKTVSLRVYDSYK